MAAPDSAAAEGLKVAGSNLSSNLPWELANSKWAATLNPILQNPILQGRLINNIKLVTGSNTINHGLQRRLRGWIVVMNSDAETFYDSQEDNQMTDLTLILNSTGPTTISLYVF